MISIPWKRAVLLALIACILSSVPAAAGLWWYHGTQDKEISVCFVGDAVTSRPDRVNEILEYISDYEHAGNLKFNYLGKCPAAVPHPSDSSKDYFEGDIRVAIPGTSEPAQGPMPGNGCPPDPYWYDANGNYNGGNDGWGSWSNPPDEVETRRSCLYNLKLGDNGDASGVPWRSHTQHEFGHALGLSHEHERKDVNTSACTAGDLPGGTAGTGYLTVYDPKSVMHYQFTNCGIDGNYSQAGLSDLDKLSIHILYPEDNRIAEFVGTTVVPAAESNLRADEPNVKLYSAWWWRGAYTDHVMKNIAWSIDGNVVGTGPVLEYTIYTPGTYTLSFSYTDFLNRNYSYSGTLIVLSKPDFAARNAYLHAARSILHQPQEKAPIESVSSTGWWYSQTLPGTGLSMEEQNDIMFLVWYVYDDSGLPVWYVAWTPQSKNKEKAASEEFGGKLRQYTGWDAASQWSLPAFTEVGEISLVLDDNDSGKLTWSLDSGGSGEVSIGKYMDSLVTGDPDPRGIDGWWYDAGYPGMGFFFETRGETLYMGWYQYRSDGSPRWWVMGGWKDVGGFPSGATSYTGELQEYRNGQTIGGVFKPAESVKTDETAEVHFSGSGRSLKISFKWTGKTFNLERYTFSSVPE